MTEGIQSEPTQIEVPQTDATAGWVLYDGNCGFCQRWIPMWEKFLTRRGFESIPLQTPWVMERTGLSMEELLQDLRILLPDGRIYAGADAYRYVARRSIWLWPFWALSMVPILHFLCNCFYKWFARNRMKNSKVCHLDPNKYGPPKSESETSTTDGV